MDELTLKQVQQFLQSNKEDEQVANYLKELSTPTIDGVKGFLDGSEDGKKLLQSLSDARVTQGIESFKQKTLPSLVDEEVSKRNPQETESDKRIRQLEERIAQKERESLLQTNKNKALSHLNDKKLPSQLVDILISDDEEVTMQNLSQFEEVFTNQLKQAVDTQVKERINNSSYTPPAGNGNTKTTYTMDQIKDLSEQEIQENWDAVQETLSDK